VTERHVAFDANNHGVRIVGVGKTFDLVSCSVWSQGGSYDNQSWSQMTKKLINPLGIELQEKGNVDKKPYEQIHVQPGEIIASAIERYAKQRKIVIGSTHDGKLLGIGDHGATEAGRLIEGENILRANGVIKDDNVYKRIYAVGQRSGNDNVWGDNASKLVAQASGSSRRERTRVVPMDVSDDQHGAEQLAKMEKVFTEGGSITHNIVVQGWFHDEGAAWKAGDYYWVRSEMLITDMLMGCRSIVYEQSTFGGTLTTLTMVDPFHMNGRPDFSGTTPTE
jgi:prophage tail gpP-like protein